MYKLLKSLAPEDAATGDKSSLRRTATAVFWSFFGIRRMGALNSDAATLTPLQLIVGGLIGAALFVVSLIALVLYLTR